MRLLPFAAWLLTIFFAVVGFLTGTNTGRGEILSIKPIARQVELQAGRATSCEFNWRNWDGKRGLGQLCVDWRESSDLAAAFKQGCGLRFRVVGKFEGGRTLEGGVYNGGEHYGWYVWRPQPGATGKEVMEEVMPLIGGTTTVHAQLFAEEPGAVLPESPVRLSFVIVGERDEDWLESNEVGYILAIAIAAAIAAGATLLFITCLSPVATDTLPATSKREATGRQGGTS